MNITPAKVRTWSKMGQDVTFGIMISEIVNENDRIIPMTADMSRYFALGKIKDKLINVGIAEESLIGAASGLAGEGFNVFAFTQAAFCVARCLDFIKVNMSYMRMPLKLVGFSSGFSLGVYGMTHIASDDIAQMRALPNLTIIQPADCTETVKAVEALSSFNNPVYLRLGGVANMPIVYREDYDFRIGKAITLKNGEDVAIIASGAIVAWALQAAEQLEGEGISCKVIDMHTVKPLDTAAVDDCLGAKLIVTCEEHSVIGGLGSAVSEHLSSALEKPPHLIIGIPDKCFHAGEYDWLLEQAGLTSKQICERIKVSLETAIRGL